MLRASARYSRARPRQSMAKPPCIGLSEFFDFSFNFFQTLPTSPSDRQCYFSGIPNLRGRSRRTTGYGDAAVAFPISDVDPKCRRLRFQLDDNLNLLYGSHKSEFANPVVAPAARHWSHSPDVPNHPTEDHNVKLSSVRHNLLFIGSPSGVAPPPPLVILALVVPAASPASCGALPVAVGSPQGAFAGPAMG
jgi:hypothetical protein